MCVCGDYASPGNRKPHDAPLLVRPSPSFSRVNMRESSEIGSIYRFRLADPRTLPAMTAIVAGDAQSMCALVMRQLTVARRTSDN